MKNHTVVTVWGSGKPRREFLYSEDMANACVFLMEMNDKDFGLLLGPGSNNHLAPLINIGSGEDITIRELAEKIKYVVKFEGDIEFNTEMPDGTQQKLMDSGRMYSLGWQPRIDLNEGLGLAYSDFTNGNG